MRNAYLCRRIHQLKVIDLGNEVTNMQNLRHLAFKWTHTEQLELLAKSDLSTTLTSLTLTLGSRLDPNAAVGQITELTQHFISLRHFTINGDGCVMDHMFPLPLPLVSLHFPGLVFKSIRGIDRAKRLRNLTLNVGPSVEDVHLLLSCQHTIRRLTLTGVSSIGADLKSTLMLLIRTAPNLHTLSIASTEQEAYVENPNDSLSDDDVEQWLSEQQCRIRSLTLDTRCHKLTPRVLIPALRNPHLTSLGLAVHSQHVATFKLLAKVIQDSSMGMDVEVC